MRIITIVILLFFSLQADETLTGLFKQLKTVSKEDKFKVVNEIKRHIIELKQQERIEAIKILKAKKEAQKKLVKQELLSESMTHISDEHTKEEHMREHMKEMKMPSKMPNMASMPNMQNMSMMRNMPLIKEMQERMRANSMEMPSSEMMSNR